MGSTGLIAVLDLILRMLIQKEISLIPTDITPYYFIIRYMIELVVAQASPSLWL